MDINTLLYFTVGLIALITGAELLVRGASHLASLLGISSLIIGLTVVAFGTSSPELAVSLQSGLSGQVDILIGNVVGSNIFNILFILGISALIAPLIVSEQLVKLDVPIMIFVSFLSLLFSMDGVLGRIDGLILFIGIIFYISFLIKLNRKKNRKRDKESSRQKLNLKDIIVYIMMIVIGLAALILGSSWLVSSAVIIAEHFGLSKLLIGLTIVAAGTSLPEVATSVVAALKGERDIAVGNLVGSNIFNILVILGISSMVVPGGISVSPSALKFDIPVMIAVA
ncbi:MAG: calcium/sodium antiporter, partial [Thermodesulfobacteriota bacterium]